MAGWGGSGNGPGSRFLVGGDHVLVIGEWPASAAGYEELTAAAVDYALGKGAILLASAGNGGSTDPLEVDANNIVSYPAAYPGVIAVAVMAPNGVRAKFSQVHTYNTISAPGVDI